MRHFLPLVSMFAVIFSMSSCVAHELVAAQMQPLVALEAAFPNSVSVSREDRLEVEFCPDNTCDVFRAKSTVPPGVMADVVFLYLFYESDFYVLKSWRSSSRASKIVGEIGGRYKVVECGDSTIQRDHCLLHELIRKYNIDVYYGRYDESERTLLKKETIR